MKTLKNYLYIILGKVYFIFVYILLGKQNFEGILAQYHISPEVISIFSGIVVMIIVYGFLGILQKIIERISDKITSKTKTKIDDMIVDLLLSSFSTLKYLLSFYAGWQLVTVPSGLNAWVDKVSSVLLLVIVLLFATNFVNHVFDAKLIAKSKIKSMSKTLLPFMRKVIIAVIWIVGVITIVGNLGYDVTALVAGAGVSGLAVALAAQKSVSNIFGALTILLNKPFEVGDYITVNGHTGTVNEIGISYITLTDTQGHQVMIPNDSIISTSVENKSHLKYRRADFSIGLIYDTSLAGMKKGVAIIEGILQQYVDDEKLQSYRVNFDMFGDFSLNINVTYFSNTFNYTDFVKEKETINLEIKQKFARTKLEMAFPTTEMIIKKGDL